MEIEVDENIQFCMNLRGKTFLAGKIKWSIRSIDFISNYNQVVAIVSKVNKTGISAVEKVQSLSEIFDLGRKESWFTEEANKYLTKLNGEFSLNPYSLAEPGSGEFNKTSPVPTMTLRAYDLVHKSQNSNPNMEVETKAN